MPFVIQFLFFLTAFLFLAAKNFPKLWKGGLIGVAIMLVADTLGNIFNLYHYHKGILMLGNYMPALHIINMFFASMIFVNWVPRLPVRRFLFILYFSLIAIGTEAAMFKAGAITYPHWKIEYSYFLTFAGLYLLALLWDRIKSPARKPLIQ